jgi:nucleoid-associated protein YgaU
MNTITVVGGNLWQIAAARLGDATQAWRIAAINGLADPMISGQVTLTIPAPDATQTGGLPVLTAD